MRKSKKLYARKKKTRKNKKYNRKYKTNKTNKTHKTHKKGGISNKLITQIQQLDVKNKYLIKFYNDEENDEIEETFSKTYDGLYEFMDWNTLTSYTGQYESVSYYKFKKDDLTIYMFYNKPPYQHKNVDLYFKILAEYDADGNLVPSKMDYRFAEEYFRPYRPIWIYCNVHQHYSQEELTNVSRVSRMSKKTLPLDIERNVQTFLVGKTKID